MEIREAWRIARPVEALALYPESPVPSIGSDAEREAIRALGQGKPLDRALAMWLELRPAGAIAQDLAQAAAQSRLGWDERGRALMVELEGRLAGSLPACTDGEVLTMAPCYLDVLELGHLISPEAHGRLFAEREVDQGMKAVPGSPTPENSGAGRPPTDESFYDWLYHRSSFKMPPRRFREILHQAYLIPHEPAKIEFAAIDAMREAYRELTECARTLADNYRLDSYESMQRIDDEVAIRFPKKPPKHPPAMEEGMRSITFPQGTGVVGVCDVRAPDSIPCPPGRPFNLSEVSDARNAAVAGLVASVLPGSPADEARRGALAAVAELGQIAERERIRRRLLEMRFECARAKLLRIVMAIGDVRLNTSKTTVRQFVDWAAEACTLSHISTLAMTLEVARVPGLGAARFLGAMAVVRAWERKRSEGRDLESMRGKLQAADGTLASLEAL